MKEEKKNKLIKSIGEILDEGNKTKPRIQRQLKREYGIKTNIHNITKYKRKVKHE